MELMCQKFQELEEQRLAFMRHQMWTMSNFCSQTLVDEDEVRGREREGERERGREGGRERGREGGSKWQYNNNYYFIKLLTAVQDKLCLLLLLWVLSNRQKKNK